MKRQVVDDARWHLDKRVPIALIVMLAIQTATIIWWASGITERVSVLEKRSEATAPQADRITRLEVNIEVVKDGIVEIKRLVQQKR